MDLVTLRAADAVLQAVRGLRRVVKDTVRFDLFQGDAAVEELNVDTVERTLKFDLSSGGDGHVGSLRAEVGDNDDREVLVACVHDVGRTLPYRQREVAAARGPDGRALLRGERLGNDVGLPAPDIDVPVLLGELVDIEALVDVLGEARAALSNSASASSKLNVVGVTSSGIETGC